MPKELVAVVLVLLVLGTAFGVWWWQRGGRAGGPKDVSNPDFGFLEYVKNPALRGVRADREAARRAVTLPERLDDAILRRWVDNLLDPARDGEFSREKLALAGPRALDALLAALDDGRFLQRDVPLTLSLYRPLTPVTALLVPLADGDARVVPVLARLLDEADPQIRKQAALALGHIARPECVAPVNRALADPDDYVRSSAMIGVDRALKAERVAPPFPPGIWDALAALLVRDDRSVEGKTAGLLLRLDRARALPTLTSPTVLRVDNPKLHYILDALNEADLPVPTDRLAELYEAAARDPSTYPNAYRLNAILLALARQHDPRAEGWIAAGLLAADAQVAGGAATALAAWRGVRDPWGKLDAAEAAGRPLDEPQRVFRAVSGLDGEVNNGGFAQYFVNSGGEHWEDARRGLRAIGCPGRLATLETVLKAFGRGGPARDGEARHRQLAAFNEQQDAVLSAGDTAWGESPEPLDAALMRYVADHAESFR